MAFTNQSSLDVVYDNKAYGNVIDPAQWNDNFKKIEEIANGNVAKVDGNFDALESVADGSSGADVIGATPVGGGAANTVQGVLEELQAFDVANVHLTGDETIAGVKTFNSSPIVPTPTTGDSSTKVASTAFVAAAMVAVGAGDMAKAIYDATGKNTNAFDSENHDYDNSTSSLTATNVQDAIDESAELISTKATTTTYTATVTTTWTGTSAPYSQAVTVTGITATDTPIVDIVPSGTYATDVTMETNWAKIYRMVTSANTITFYAHSVPTADIPLQILVVR